ncbi:uncharacterized protein J3R85_011063 [Psidium guajava]|nr:uncharacterized protein J3R85_011063 [Psidium guajava]
MQSLKFLPRTVQRSRSHLLMEVSISIGIYMNSNDSFEEKP